MELPISSSRKQPATREHSAVLSRIVRCIALRWVAIATATFYALVPAIARGPLQTARAHSSQEANQEAVRLSSVLVQVPVVVTRIGGGFVGDLTKADFSVYEDGKRQELSLFSALSQPFTAALVLDTSNSASDRLAAIKRLAGDFIKQLQPADRMMTIAFDNEVRKLTDFTADGAELADSIKDLESGFGKLLYEAVQMALEQLRDVEGRRAVVLFTDGVDMKSIDATAEGVGRLADEVGAVVYVVKTETRWWLEAEARRQKAEHPTSKVPFHVDGRIPLPPDFGGPDPDPTPTGFPKIPKPRIEVGTGGGPVGGRDGQPAGLFGRVERDDITRAIATLYGEADRFLLQITASTGGQVLNAESFASTQSAFARVAAELRNQYLLGYYPAASARGADYRRIKVEVGRRDVRIRARQGYRARS
jgi:VWFA-related protein